MKRSEKLFLLVLILLLSSLSIAQQGVPARAKAYETAPDIPYDSVPNFLKMPPNLYLGEGIGVARNSKGHVFVFTRSGATRLFEFDQNGVFVREIGQGLYGFEMAHDSLLWRNWKSSISAMAEFFERNLHAKR